jgi:coronin-1B/1C/6
LCERRSIVRSHELLYHLRSPDQSTSTFPRTLFADTGRRQTGHVFGQTTKREQCYDNLRVSRNAWDTNLIKANPKYLAVNWEAGGGGAFAVIPLDERGKLPDQLPLFRGHTAVVLDTDWSPFDDSLIASASDDGKVFLWQVPEDFALRTEAEEIEDVAPIGKLSGHSRCVWTIFLFQQEEEDCLACESKNAIAQLREVTLSRKSLMADL